MYWGTGNAQPWAPQNRGGLDSLYTSSLLAIRPQTGELVWHYQYTPNDVYDVDGTDEPVLADIVTVKIAAALSCARRGMVRLRTNGENNG